MKVFKSPYKNWNFAHIADAASVFCYLLCQCNVINPITAKIFGIGLKFYNIALMSDERIDAENKIDGIFSNVSQLSGFWYLGSNNTNERHISGGSMCFSLALKLITIQFKDDYPTSLGVNRDLAVTFQFTHGLYLSGVHLASLAILLFKTLISIGRQFNDDKADYDTSIVVVIGVINLILSALMTHSAIYPLQVDPDISRSSEHNPGV